MAPLRLRTQQPTQKQRVDSAAKPHLAIDLYDRHALSEPLDKFRISIDVHQLRRESKTMKYLRGIVAQMAPAPRVKHNVHAIVGVRAS